MPPVSKIAQLPKEIRTWLERAIIERAFGDIVQICDELNAMCKKGGVAITVGKSAVGVEAQRIKRAQETIAATTRHMQLIAESARDGSALRSEALNAALSTDLFETVLLAREAESEPDLAKRVALLNKASLAAARLSTTNVQQLQFRAEVEKRMQAAAEKVSKLAKKGGMDAKTVAEIRSSILGIVKREAPAAAAPT